jgi:hypothetical protein
VTASTVGLSANVLNQQEWMMGRYSISGVCIPIGGYDTDHIEFGDDLVGACSLIERATGVEHVDWSLATAFEMEKGENDEFWGHYITGFRESGKKYPPAFKARISVEAEQLQGDELEKFWEDRKARLNTDCADSAGAEDD